METGLSPTLQLAVAGACVLSIALGVILGIRMETKDLSMPPILFVAGLFGSALGTIALVLGVGAMCAVGPLVGALMIGLSVGLTSTRRQG
jgi:hypothetical protein